MFSNRALLFRSSTVGLLCSVSSLGLAQDSPLDLGTLVLRGEKINRTTEDAPASISVISGEDVETPSNTDIDDVINSQPNVLANEGFKPPAIRGVDGQGGDRPAITAGSQPRIPVLVDDVPIPSGEASNITQTSTWDVDTVEVARGPQATSTGRNALGGAIRVYTKDPVFFSEGAVRFSFNDQQQSGVAFMVNTPIVKDQLAFRFTGEYFGGESYINNNPNPLPAGFDPNITESKRVRAKLLWEPAAAPGLSLLFSAEHTDIKGPTEGFFNGNIDGLSVNGVFAFASAYEDVEQSIYSARATYEFSENVAVVARLAYLENDLLFRDTGETLFPGATFGATGFNKELTETEVYVRFQDLGIVNTGVFGVIHSEEDEVGFNNGALLSFNLTGKIENTGIYGEVELDAGALLPGVAVILGGRYEMDERSRTTFDGAGNLVGSGSFSEDVFLPKLGLRYDLNDRTSFGYVYSEGFRGGGLDVDLGAPFGGFAFSSVAFGPERLKQHELYAKTTVLGGQFDLAASAFFYIWEDAHVSGAAVYPASGDSALGNIPEAEGRGLELSATYRATSTLTFDGAIGLLDTEITKVTAAQAGFLGLDLPRAPNTTASLGVSYEGPNGFDAYARARFVGDHFSALNQAKLDDYTVVDIGFGYEFEVSTGKTMRVEGFVENLFDERYLTFTEATAFGGLNKVGQPRTFGISATMKF